MQRYTDERHGQQVSQVKKTIMQQEEKCGTCFFIGWPVIKTEAAFLHPLQREYIKEIEDADQHTLHPVQRNDGMDGAGILLVLPDDPAIYCQQNV